MAFSIGKIVETKSHNAKKSSKEYKRTLWLVLDSNLRPPAAQTSASGQELCRGCFLDSFFNSQCRKKPEKLPIGLENRFAPQLKHQKPLLLN